MNFVFKTDSESQKYCDLIANEMIKVYKVSEDEAIRRINRFWGHLEMLNDDDLIYHEMPDYWADAIFNDYEEE